MGFLNFLKKKTCTEVDIHLINQQIYQDVFNKIQDHLPQGWQKVDFHMFHTSRTFGMKYYVLTDKNEWVDCFKLLDKQTTRELFLSIDDNIAILWGQLPPKHKWYVLNMIIDNQGQMNVSHDYADKIQNDDEKLFDYLYEEEKEWNKKFIV